MPGPKNEKVAGDWKKLHNNHHHCDQVKKDEMGETCRIMGG
jgi:hypothetical protein